MFSVDARDGHADKHLYACDHDGCRAHARDKVWLLLLVFQSWQRPFAEQEHWFCWRRKLQLQFVPLNQILNLLLHSSVLCQKECF